MADIPALLMLLLGVEGGEYKNREPVETRFMDDGVFKIAMTICNGGNRDMDLRYAGKNYE